MVGSGVFGRLRWVIGTAAVPLRHCSGAVSAADFDYMWLWWALLKNADDKKKQGNSLKILFCRNAINLANGLRHPAATIRGSSSVTGLVGFMVAHSF